MKFIVKRGILGHPLVSSQRWRHQPFHYVPVATLPIADWVMAVGVLLAAELYYTTPAKLIE